MVPVLLKRRPSLLAVAQHRKPAVTHSNSSAPNRRQFVQCAAAAAAALGYARFAQAADAEPFSPRYLLASSMYGYTELAEILPEVKKTGATAIDIWPKVHGNQREQLDGMGEAKFAAMLQEHGVTLGCITQYKLGPFALQDEMRLAQRLGCPTIVTSAKGPRGQSGSELKQSVRQFVEQMKPHLAVAEETGTTVAIENHANNLIESPDGLKWLAELSSGMPLAIALAPYHLPQDTRLLSELIVALGNRIAVFYAWQHGMGATGPLPKEQELMQMPGRGTLDFQPLLAALRQIEYHGWTEIFMHPFPRGVPIMGSTAAVTAEINRARQYLASF